MFPRNPTGIALENRLQTILLSASTDPTKSLRLQVGHS